MNKRQAEILKQRIAIMKPLQDRYHDLVEKIAAETDEDKKDMLRCQIGLVVEEMNNVRLPRA